MGSHRAGGTARAYSVARSTGRPSFACAAVRAASGACPTCVSRSISSRRWLSNSSRISPEPPKAMASERFHSRMRVSNSGMTRPPQFGQSCVDHVPLLLLPRQGALPSGAEGVVFPLAPGFGHVPARADESLRLQAVQHRIEHAVGPLNLPARYVPDTL